MSTQIEKTYSYDKTNKDGTKTTKIVKRKYTNKLDRSNTLQNSENKRIVIENILKHKDKILELECRKRVKYVRENCIPEGITASYKALTSLIIKYVLTKDSQLSQEDAQQSSATASVKEEVESQDSN